MTYASERGVSSKETISGFNRPPAGIHATRRFVIDETEKSAVNFDCAVIENILGGRLFRWVDVFVPEMRGIRKHKMWAKL
jgi:hypothetical protein